VIATSPAYHGHPSQRLLQNFPDITLLDARDPPATAPAKYDEVGRLGSSPNGLATTNEALMSPTINRFEGQKASEVQLKELQNDADSILRRISAS
jgi:hypothetical protein